MSIYSHKLIIKTGKGGYGSSSHTLRFGKRVYDGGNGGKGGNIIFIRDINKVTLGNIVGKDKVVGNNGYNGKNNNYNGKSGKNIKISVCNNFRLYIQQKNCEKIRIVEINSENDHYSFYGTIGGRGSRDTKTPEQHLIQPKANKEFFLIIKAIIKPRVLYIFLIEDRDITSSLIKIMFNRKNIDNFLIISQKQDVYCFLNIHSGNIEYINNSDDIYIIYNNVNWLNSNISKIDNKNIKTIFYSFIFNILNFVFLY
ncbi:GTPase Obg [bacterium AB1]|nr:GTPase Obg [bacterium AB1]